MWRGLVLPVELVELEPQERVSSPPARRASRWRCPPDSARVGQAVRSRRSYGAAEGGWRAGRRVALSRGCRAAERLAGHSKGLEAAGGGRCSANQLTAPRVGRHSCPGHLARSGSWAPSGSPGPGDAPCSCPCPPPPSAAAPAGAPGAGGGGAAGTVSSPPLASPPAPRRRTRGLGTGTPASERLCSGTAPPARSFAGSRGRCCCAPCWQQP